MNEFFQRGFPCSKILIGHLTRKIETSEKPIDFWQMTNKKFQWPTIPHRVQESIRDVISGNAHSNGRNRPSADISIRKSAYNVETIEDR